MLFNFKSQNYSYEDVLEALKKSSYPSVDFYILMSISVIIASLGLLLNSVAIIIGAMIIAPLMDPLLGVSFSSLTRNFHFKFQSLLTIISGILLGLVISFVIGSLFSFIGKTPEIIARTQPTTLDLFVALASGFIGGYAKVRKTVGGTIYGVAIAISLVPPLAVVGIGIAYQDPAIYGGAFLLFITNVVSVILSGIFAFMLMDFQYFQKTKKALIAPMLIITVLTVPLTLSYGSLVEKRLLRNELSRSLTSDTYTFRHLDVVETKIDPYQKPVLVEVTVRASSDEVNQAQLNQVQAFLSKKINRPVQLILHITPIVSIHANAKTL